MESGIAIMMTVYNSKEKVCSFLDNCYHQIDAMRGLYPYIFDIYVVDDGSIDGTSDIIKNVFPDVHLIKGDGRQYWNQGMRLAWKTASRQDYDFYIWANINTVLRDGAIAAMMENSQYLGNKAIIAGSAVDVKGNLTSGGRTRTNKIVVPESVIPVPCFTINGNFVLVPRSVYKELGNFDHRYHHALGDLDYGVRAFKAGIPRVVAPGVLADYNPDMAVPKWRDSAYSLKERYRYFLGPKGHPPKEQFVYDMRSVGFFQAVAHFLTLNIKVIFAHGKKTTAVF